MSKATETKLATLHGIVAEVLSAQLNYTEEEMNFDLEGNEVATGKQIHTASPATVAAAIKFLKDNQITCDIEVDANMNNLRESLANKQRHSRLGSASEAAKLKVVGD